MTNNVYNVLILCTGNSARSIMAEAIFNTKGQGRFQAYSAGSHPTGKVHPLAFEQAQAIGYPVEHLRSKSWDEFTGPNAPQMDFIITVCDNAAGELCPIWPGRPISAHWGVEDPAGIQGSDKDKRQAFEKAFECLSEYISQLVRLPLEDLKPDAIKKALSGIGPTEAVK